MDHPDSDTPDEAVAQVPGILVCDAEALYDACKSETSALGLKERRSGIELLGLKENLQRSKTLLRWVNSGAMLADPMTKGRMGFMMEEFLANPSWKIVDDPKFESYKKRCSKGNDAFEKKPEQVDLDAVDAETESEDEDESYIDLRAY